MLISFRVNSKSHSCVKISQKITHEAVLAVATSMNRHTGRCFLLSYRYIYPVHQDHTRSGNMSHWRRKWRYTTTTCNSWSHTPGASERQGLSVLVEGFLQAEWHSAGIRSLEWSWDSRRDQLQMLKDRTRPIVFMRNTSSSSVPAIWRKWVCLNEWPPLSSVHCQA